MYGLSIILLMFLVACSASTNYPMDIDYNTPLHYNYESLQYENLSGYDIYSYLFEDYTDLIAVLRTHSTNTTLNQSWEQYELTLLKLKSIGIPSVINPSALFDKTSSELNQLATTHEIVLTVDDIIRFNDLKAIFKTLSGGISISKTLLIEYRLGRTMTSDEMEGLDLLQQYYLDLTRKDIPSNLREITYEELETNLLLLRIPPTTDELILIEQGYNLLVSLME